MVSHQHCQQLSYYIGQILCIGHETNPLFSFTLTTTRIMMNTMVQQDAEVSINTSIVLVYQIRTQTYSGNRNFGKINKMIFDRPGGDQNLSINFNWPYIMNYWNKDVCTFKRDITLISIQSVSCFQQQWQPSWMDRGLQQNKQLFSQGFSLALFSSTITS